MVAFFIFRIRILPNGWLFGDVTLEKTRIKPGFNMLIHDAPPNYFEWIGPLPEKVHVDEHFTTDLNFLHVFVKDQKTFRLEIAKSKKNLKRDGMIWISWPKKASGVLSDLDENIILDYGIELGLVDIKVCAVSEICSGLKFVIPVRDR